MPDTTNVKSLHHSLRSSRRSSLVLPPGKLFGRDEEIKVLRSCLHSNHENTSGLQNTFPKRIIGTEDPIFATTTFGSLVSLEDSTLTKFLESSEDSIVWRIAKGSTGKGVTDDPKPDVCLVVYPTVELQCYPPTMRPLFQPLDSDVITILAPLSGSLLSSCCFSSIASKLHFRHFHS